MMKNTLDQPIINLLKKIKFDHLFLILLITLAILTRFPGLGDRVMSHDEVNHVVPSFDLYSGKGYRHDPITHGPLQFHLIAFSYFLFGDSDFSSRFPHAVFSVLTIAFVAIFYRRYLGKFGSIAAGLFFVISPFMMFYGRYARNESICIFLNVLSLYAVLRYLEEKRLRFLYLFTIALSLNFTTKETAYIFTAQLLIFLFILTIQDITQIQWGSREKKRRFLLTNLIIISLIGVCILLSILFAKNSFLKIQDGTLSLESLNSPATTGLATSIKSLGTILSIAVPVIAPLILALVGFLYLRGRLQWEYLNSSRAFQLLIFTGAFVLPLLAPFLVRFAGVDPSAYADPFAVLLDLIYIVFLFGISATVASMVDQKNWWKYYLTFFGIYFILYTTFFTNTAGIMTGMVGSLGHWLAQQDVQRGGQPYYYYALIQIPIYEFLGAFGSLIAFLIGLNRKSFWMENKTEPAQSGLISQMPSQRRLPVPAIFLYWTITSLIAFTLAGEKMPWLTVHIAFSMLLTAGWVVDYLLKKLLINNRAIKIGRPALLIFGLLISVGLFLLSILGTHPPFQGKTTQQLQDTNHFIFISLALVIFGYFSYREFYPKGLKRFKYQSLIIIFVFLSLITFRTAYQATFINYDYPYEFLVYAHAADGPKIILDQIETISRRTTQGLGIKVAYDNHGLYPYWWYLRNYPNKIVYLENPTRALEEAPLIIAGQDKYAKLEPIVRDNYYYSEYMRLWWPMQDYWNLTWDRVGNALSDKEMRQALFDIWFNRNYSLYAETTGNEFLTLENWLPSEKMRLYIRKDIAAQMWDLTTATDFSFEYEDNPYESVMISRQPDYFIGSSGTAAGELNAPRGIDIAPDSTIFVADSMNHRIQQLSQTGKMINSWGSYANILEGDAPGGTFHEPWDVAVSENGFVYVADTFNHRIQKFTQEGQFIKSWGEFAQGNSPESFWGPRGIAISPDGRILVTDTGNKRVVVFDQDLNYITQFGGAGFEAGQFDEPVGIAIDDTGKIYIADTWNRRIQIFSASSDGLTYAQVGEFEVNAWYGQSIENKPFITVSPSGTIMISDPEGGRILEFSESGEILRGWRDLAVTDDLISQPFGLDFDVHGNLWVTDGLANVLMRFDLQN